MDPRISTVNLASKFDSFSDLWAPKIVGALNNQLVKVAKFEGEFVMHHHEHEDELFLVVEGTLFIELADQTLKIGAGEFVVIPRGVDHRPYAPSLVKVMLFEPATTLNTGNTTNDFTKSDLETL